ncbi:hypothetical protein GPECTOR_6g710 [Gonium pectorale]|uniref:Uncharacterized protein n=1 Tax=Gonium pectorale TaxID=33097 RepID=A0A150GVR1_GONPE|nr:hypothetical protein GPECTOR_6g710 [Gonium pectorale]|eukprot:KXZ53792.1 hypothetical protein GPECTOR_6g710 [Gonium pectorale]
MTSLRDAGSHEPVAQPYPVMSCSPRDLDGPCGGEYAIFEGVDAVASLNIDPRKLQARAEWEWGGQGEAAGQKKGILRRLLTKYAAVAATAATPSAVGPAPAAASAAAGAAASAATGPASNGGSGSCSVGRHPSQLGIPPWRQQPTGSGGNALTGSGSNAAVASGGGGAAGVTTTPRGGASAPGLSPASSVGGGDGGRRSPRGASGRPAHGGALYAPPSSPGALAARARPLRATAGGSTDHGAGHGGEGAAPSPVNGSRTSPLGQPPLSARRHASPRGVIAPNLYGHRDAGGRDVKTPPPAQDFVTPPRGPSAYEPSPPQQYGNTYGGPVYVGTSGVNDIAFSEVLLSEVPRRPLATASVTSLASTAVTAVTDAMAAGGEAYRGGPQRPPPAPGAPIPQHRAKYAPDTSPYGAAAGDGAAGGGQRHRQRRDRRPLPHGAGAASADGDVESEAGGRVGGGGGGGAGGDAIADEVLSLVASLEEELAAIEAARSKHELRLKLVDSLLDMMPGGPGGGPTRGSPTAPPPLPAGASSSSALAVRLSSERARLLWELGALALRAELLGYARGEWGKVTAVLSGVRVSRRQAAPLQAILFSDTLARIRAFQKAQARRAAAGGPGPGLAPLLLTGPPGAGVGGLAGVAASSTGFACEGRGGGGAAAHLSAALAQTHQGFAGAYSSSGRPPVPHREQHSASLHPNKPGRPAPKRSSAAYASTPAPPGSYSQHHHHHHGGMSPYAGQLGGGPTGLPPPGAVTAGLAPITEDSSPVQSSSANDGGCFRQQCGEPARQAAAGARPPVPPLRLTHATLAAAEAQSRLPPPPHIQPSAAAAAARRAFVQADASSLPRRQLYDEFAGSVGTPGVIPYTVRHQAHRYGIGHQDDDGSADSSSSSEMYRSVASLARHVQPPEDDYTGAAAGYGRQAAAGSRAPPQGGHRTHSRHSGATPRGPGEEVPDGEAEGEGEGESSASSLESAFISRCLDYTRNSLDIRRGPAAHPSSQPPHAQQRQQQRPHRTQYHNQYHSGAAVSRHADSQAPAGAAAAAMAAMAGGMSQGERQLYSSAIRQLTAAAAASSAANAIHASAYSTAAATLPINTAAAVAGSPPAGGPTAGGGRRHAAADEYDDHVYGNEDGQDEGYFDVTPVATRGRGGADADAASTPGGPASASGTGAAHVSGPMSGPTASSLGSVEDMLAAVAQLRGGPLAAGGRCRG